MDLQYLSLVTRLFSCCFYSTNSSSSPVPFVCFEVRVTPLSSDRLFSLFNLEECQDVENISFCVFPVTTIVKINIFLELLSHCSICILIGSCEYLILKTNLTKLLGRKNVLQCIQSKFGGCGYPRAEPFDAFKNGGLTLPVQTTSSLEKC